MAFIGIVTESKAELQIRQNLKREFERINVKKTIIIINKNSIKNLFNVKFEFLIIYRNIFSNNDDLVKIVLNSDRIIVNADYDENLEAIKNLKLNVITYGMNSKATLTLSSVSDEGTLITLQRAIKNSKKELVEPQEIKISGKNFSKNLYVEMILAIFLIIFDKI